MKTRTRQAFLWVFAGVLSVFSLAAGADGGCGGSAGPGATLLFPYFEVDPGGGQDRTTLISIQNFSPQPHLAHVVLWSNCAVPMLDFDLYLGAYALRSIDLRIVLLEGLLPESDALDQTPAGCTSPLALPAFDPAVLRRKLRGDPVGGHCYAAATDEPAVTGYLTVDVVTGCSETLRTPYDEGYFGPGGLAGSENVLTGELFFIDSPGDAAQAVEAVSLRAVAGLGERSFYRRGDDRQELPAVHQVHYLNGGAFDGGTDLLYWFDQTWHLSEGEVPGPWSCSDPPTSCGSLDGAYTFVVRGRNEAGVQPALPGKLPKVYSRWSSLRAGRLRVGKDVPVAVPFGTLEVCPGFNYGGPAPLGQSWILPVHTAEGRYSAALSSDGLCGAELPRHPPLVEVPPWVQDVITSIECAPNGRLGPVRYLYKGEYVYLLPSRPCCDDAVPVYNEDGEYICSPAGGVSGQGDFQCPDFFDVATDRTEVWEDPTKPEESADFWP